MNAVFLSPEEMQRFAAYCLFQAENEALLIEQLKKLPINMPELTRVKHERITAYRIVASQLKAVEVMEVSRE